MKKSLRSIILFLIAAIPCVFFYDKLTDSLEKPPFLTVVGFVKMADGLGRQCPDMIDALHQDFKIGFYPLAKSNFRDVPKKIRPILRHPNKKLGKVVFLNDMPYRPSNNDKPYGALRFLDSKRNEDQLRICYTMLESSKIPESWVNVLNEYFDAVAVPDEFLVDAFVASGVHIPVFVLPLGLPMDDFLSRPIKEDFNDVFTFATMGALGERKNQLKLIEAFDLAFNKDPKIKLLIHARGGDETYTNKVLAFLDVIKNPQVVFSKNSLAKQDYLNFMQSVDMLVNVSKGEGFSIQPREAMALGIPVLITDNSAQSSIVKNATCSSLACTLKEPAFYNHLKAFAGHFMDYSVEELAEKLKDAYANRYELLKAKETNKQYAATFHYSKVKPLYKNIIAPKKVVLGQQNKIHEEYLETSSTALFEKYMKLTGANQ